ncbi:MAG: putative Ig domain-containing protein, partial [Candidatus Magasanikbacteria bacterium]|nr:putative Ig domain-containing protein [Candidatus Magasanikbacteria bacterium]
DFISSSGSTSQTRLFWPKGAVYNSASNTLFVSEAFNQRITVFDLNNLLTTSTPASAVIGQADFISGTSGVSHTKLNNPYGLDYDSSENLLFVSDNSNNRVLSFDLNNLLTTSTPANAVIGQTNFDSNASATTQSGLYSPHGVSYNSANNSLYVADYNNNRVVEFNFVYFSNPSTLSTTTVGATYSTTTISAINNQSALSYSLFSGDLPTGLSFNTSTGVISGTSLVAGTSTFTLKASDTFGDSSEFFNKKMFTIASAYALSSVPSSVLAAANSATQITVSWSGDADSYYVENITASTNSGWVGGETEPSAVFSSLTCGTSYSFRVKGRNADNIETSFSTSTSATTNSCPVSGGSGGGGGGSVVSQPPIVSSQMNAVLVSSVDNQTVTLNFSVANAVQIAISEDQNFANSSWQLYASSKQFKLSAGNGQKIIYVKFRSVSGGETATYKVFVNSDTNKSIAPVVLNINKPDVVATSEIVNKFILSNPESKVVISPVKTITYKPNSIVAYNYSYKNESDKTQKVRIVRTLENGSGKVVDKASGYTSVLKDKTFKFKASSSLNSRLADGKYIVKVQILDFKTNKLLDQNSFEINVKKPILVKSAAKKR